MNYTCSQLYTILNQPLPQLLLDYLERKPISTSRPKGQTEAVAWIGCLTLASWLYHSTRKSECGAIRASERQYQLLEPNRSRGCDLGSWQSM
jgi:hypothetical protein